MENSLTYVLTTTKPDDSGHRWVASLANYDFSIFYKTGRNNIEVDALYICMGPKTAIQVYTCNVFVLDKTQRIGEPKEMTIKK